MPTPADLHAIEDWDTYSGQNVNGEKLLKQPSTDIKGDLKTALSVALDKRPKQLHHVLRSWKQNLSSNQQVTPSFLACFLEDEYETSALKATSLTDKDALLIHHVAPLAKAYGFDLHLAEVTYTVDGGVTWGHQYDTYKAGISFERRSYDDSDDDDYYSFYDYRDPYEVFVDPEVVKMNKRDVSHNLHFSDVLALDGMPMNMSGAAVDGMNDVDDDGNIKDINLYFVNGEITEADRQANFFHEDAHCGSLRYTYQRNALLISPANSQSVKFTTGFIRDFACSTLSSSLSKAMSVKERKLVGSLYAWVTKLDESLSAADKLPPYQRKTDHDEAAVKQVMNALRESAQRWNTPAAFVDALKRCAAERRITAVGIEGLVSAYQTFGWHLIKDLYADAVSKTMSRCLCGPFIAALVSAATTRRDTNVVSWCRDQSESVLSGIEKVEESELDWVLALIGTKSEPTQFLNNTLIPLLQKIDDMELWSAFLTRLHDLKPPKSSTWKVGDHPRLINHCLKEIANAMDPYPVKPNPKAEYAYCAFSVASDIPTVEPIVSFIKLGVRVNAVQSCMPLLERMWTEKGAQRLKDEDLSAVKYYSDLVDELVDFAGDKPTIKQTLRPFFTQAAEFLLPQYTAHSSEFQKAVKASGNAIGFLKDSLTPECVERTPRSTFSGLAKFAVELLAEEAKSARSKADLKAIVKLCLEAAIQKCDLRWESGINVLKLCYTLQMPSYADAAFSKFLSLPDHDVSFYVRSGLAPVLHSLPGFLESNQLAITDAPFSTFATEVIKLFVREALGEKPEEVVSLDELKAIPCGCYDCSRFLKRFLFGHQDETEVREKQKVRTHLEKRLAKTRAWGFTWETIKEGSPHTLRIEKPESVTLLAQWEKTKQRR
ncbi:hypothetical protein BDZ89DRAFT_202902 [Hymenopellis radicata]|nr:hypothetical protein BDZ89DRAFT_202902 [Hymenopellis radicata]